MPDDGCPFCRIAAGEAEAHVVLEDELTVAFLDVRPLFAGHTLLVPRAHHEAIWDLPPELVAPYFGNVRLLASAVREAMDAAGAFVALNNLVSQSVPHLHTHVVPRNRKDGLRGFFWPRRKYEGESEAEGAAEAIRAAVARHSS